MSSKEDKNSDVFSKLYYGIFIIVISMGGLAVDLKDILLLGEVHRVSRTEGGFEFYLRGAGDIALILILLGLGINICKIKGEDFRDSAFVRSFDKISLKSYIKSSVILVLLASVYGLFKNKVFVENMVCLFFCAFVFFKMELVAKMILFLYQKIKYYFEIVLKEWNEFKK